MKKLLAVLGLSLAVLAGLLVYAGYTWSDGEKLIEEVTTPELISLEVTPIPTKEVAKPTPVVEKTDEVVVEEEELDWDESVEEELASVNDDFSVDVPTHDSYSYAYSTLSDSQKALYDVIYAATISFSESVVVPTMDISEIDKVFNCVMIDHPEIFYVNGYRYTKYTQGDKLKKIAFTASYCYSKAETEKLQASLDAEINKILANIYPGASDYLKIKYLFDYIVDNTEYDLNSPDNQNIISVLINKRSVCQGYAKTFQLLLNKTGIPCTLITGVVNTGERHAWNAVKADGEWYYADVTWGDASYRISDESQTDFAPKVNYDYMLVNSAEINKTHTSDSPMPIPNATSLTDNYFVQEGLYIMGYDPNQLKLIFDYRKSLGEPTVTLKCADSNVYNVLRAELIDNQKIFDYVNTGQIRYYESDETNKLVFALN